MTGKLFVSLLFLGTLISCAKDGSDDKSSEPIAKPDTEMEEAFAEFTYPSFQNAEWQDKCDAIESFVVAFATTYLDDIAIEDTSPCAKQRLSAELASSQYSYSFTYSNGVNLQSFEIAIAAAVSKSTGSISIVSSQETTDESKDFDTNLGNRMTELPEIFAMWLEGNQPAKVFGIDYEAYVNQITTLGLGPQGLSLKPNDRQLDVRFLDRDFAPNSGNAELINLPETYYKEDESTDTKSFAGCPLSEGLGCVNALDIRYIILGNEIHLVFHTGNSVGITQSWISVYLGNFPKE
ncbi:MAG: hypothetical protein HRU19_01395 [Pseudobacteriovorax sp.]|nr:hypothetical protein [Pseudobacteriovorax sp.]